METFIASTVSCRTENKRKKDYNACINHDHCSVEMPNEYLLFMLN